jgi:hypothetical protein
MFDDVTLYIAKSTLKMSPSMYCSVLENLGSMMEPWFPSVVDIDVERRLSKFTVVA